MSNTIEVKLEISRAELEGALATMDRPDDLTLGAQKPVQSVDVDDVTRAHFIEPVSVIAVATLAWVTKRVVDHWLKTKEWGVQIDLRESPPCISRIAGTPQGCLVVIDTDGKAQIHQAAKGRAEDLSKVIEMALG